MINVDGYTKDLIFYLQRSDNKRIVSKHINSDGGSFYTCGRPSEIFLDITDINNLISALQSLKEDAGYKMEI